MKKLIIFIFLTVCFTSLFAQFRLEVEGDGKIRGKMDIIQAVGDSSLFIGTNAGLNDKGNNENAFIGTNAGKSNTSGKANTFFGVSAGSNNTTGNFNTFIGNSSGVYNTTGAFNTFIGNSSGVYTTGNFNTFIGARTGQSNTTGGDNTFLGNAAGSFNSTGSANVFLGRSAGERNTTGKDNIFLGRSAGRLNSTGNENTFIGGFAGFNNTGKRNTFLGYNANSSVTDSLDLAIAIGFNAMVNCDNCAAIGGTGADAVNVGIGITRPLNPLHIIQSNSVDAQRGIRLDYHDNTQYWTTYGDGNGRYNFTYNGAALAYITPQGEYVDAILFTSNKDGRISRTSKIKSMNKVLTKVKRLQPITKKITNGRTARTVWGFDVGKVAHLFPEITPEKDGQKGIIYDYFGILSIKAIQELAADLEMSKMKNKNLKEELVNQQEQIDELKSLVENLLNQNTVPSKSPSYMLSLKQKISLTQNQPNPFREITAIDYFIPLNVKNAYIQITNLDGQILEKVKISQLGKGQVTIQSKNYPSGTYFYSLVLDGQMIDTKQMVVAN